MAYKTGSREQLGLFPERIEDYVGENDPVRVYDAFVESLKFDELGVQVEAARTGAPAYEPRAMIKLLLYGPSYGVKSSRKLERATHHNISFMWLTGGLKPDYRTIARFRRRNRNALQKILGQCARMCMKLELVEGNILFVDGSKFRANASIKKSWDKGKCEVFLKDLDKRIEKLLRECEQIDEAEEGDGSLVEIGEELRDSKKLKERIRGILENLEEEDRKSVNTTDKESVRVKGRQGGHQGYSSQIVVDDKNGLIVNTDVVSQSNDNNQLSCQVRQAEEVLDKKSKIVCADAGYSDMAEIKEIQKRGRRLIVPSKWQATQKEGIFSKNKFTYDEERDEYSCPEGKILRRQKDRGGKRAAYIIRDVQDCRKCIHHGICTKGKRGRVLNDSKEDEHYRREQENEYIKPESRRIYKRRKEKVELPFGHIKRNLGTDNFLLRGREGVKAEMSIFATCFNLSRMMTLLGVNGLIKSLKVA